MDTKTQTAVFADRCWIRPNAVADDRHFPTRQAALEPDDPYDTDWRVPAVRQLDTLCVTVACACCGYAHDEPENSVVYHSGSVGEAEQAAAGDGWTRDADGWTCRLCAAGTCDWHKSALDGGDRG